MDNIEWQDESFIECPDFWYSNEEERDPDAYDEERALENYDHG